MVSKTEEFNHEVTELREKCKVSSQDGLKTQQALKSAVAEKNLIDSQLADVSKSLHEAMKENESALCLIASRDQEITCLNGNVLQLKNEKEFIQRNLTAKEKALEHTECDLNALRKENSDKIEAHKLEVLKFSQQIDSVKKELKEKSALDHEQLKAEIEQSNTALIAEQEKRAQLKKSLDETLHDLQSTKVQNCTLK